MLILPRHRLVQLGDLSGPVRFDDCDELIEQITAILHGWRIEEVDPDPQRPAPMRIRRVGGGYRRVSARHDTPSRSRAKARGHVVEALCGFHFELIDWYIDEHPDRLFVHGAGVFLPSGLTLFPALAKAGKSTLTIALAARGHRVHGDDVVPIDVSSGQAVGLGMAPRIRPPLPPGVSPALRAFAARHRGPTYGNRSYICLPDAQVAPLGERAPITGIVLLDRVAKGAARLVRVSKADALEKIVLQNFTREVPADDILSALHGVVDGAECHALRYADVEEAAERLEEMRIDG